LAIDDASYVLSKIEIAAWGPTLNKHHCAVLAAPGVNSILARRPHRKPLGCKAEVIADTGIQLIGHLDGDL
jgi:hypothetical protein